LTDDGVIFISIDDNEVHNLRKICDEVFGEENFVAQIVWQKNMQLQMILKVFLQHTTILLYIKKVNSFKEIYCQELKIKINLIKIMIMMDGDFGGLIIFW